MQAHRQLQWVLLAAACAQLVLLLVPSAMSALHSSAHATAPPGPAAAARASSWVDAAQQGVALLGVVCAALLLTLWARLAAQHAQPPRQHSSECAAAAAAAAIKPSRAQAPAPASGGTPDCTLAAAGCLRARLPPPAPAPPCVDVWVLAGQSNCVGTNQADGHDMPPRAAPAPGRILSYNRAGGCWQHAQPNIHLGVYGYADAYSCGPDMAFAHRLLETGAAHTVGFVPTACGGTNLYRQWAPGGELWSNMVADTHAALRLLGPGRGRLRGLIWIQGESDALQPDTAAAYGANLSAWLAATRAALATHVPRLPVLLVVMAERGRTRAFPFIETVAQQQRALRPCCAARPQPSCPAAAAAAAAAATQAGACLCGALIKVEMAGFEFYPQEVASCAPAAAGGAGQAAPGGAVGGAAGAAPCGTAGGARGTADAAQLVHLTKEGCCALGSALADAWARADAVRGGGVCAAAAAAGCEHVASGCRSHERDMCRERAGWGVTLHAIAWAW